jgi:hypothetical protein
MRNVICACLIAVAPASALAQSIPAITESTEGVQRAPGPTPADPLAAKLIAIDPAQAAFVETYNADIEALYNRPTVYLQVINGFCVPTPMTQRQFFSLTRR